MAKHIASISHAQIADIRQEGRLRPVSGAAVAALKHVIEEHGFTVPVLVRHMKGGSFTLIDGANRLAAMIELGESRIPVHVVECTAAEARAMEASQNLAGAGMSPLDDALFLAAYADAYEELHPETKGGVAGGLARQGLATELSSFAEVMAEKRAITPRQVRKIVAAGRRITRDDAEMLRTATRKVTLKDIEDLGKISETEERSAVVLRLASGNAKSASAARRSLQVEQGDKAPLKDPAEDQFMTLSKAWARAGIKARKRFLMEYAREIWDDQNAGVSLVNWASAGESAASDEEEAA